MSIIRSAGLVAGGALGGCAALIALAVRHAPPSSPEEWAYFTVLVPPAQGLRLPGEVAGTLAAETASRREAVRPYRRRVIERHARGYSLRQSADMLAGHARECGFC